MSVAKPPCTTVRKWLRDNLGKDCLGVLTGTDSRMLDAAAQIVYAMAYDESPELIQAFALVVDRMQWSAQELAYHAIAHTGNWSDRRATWDRARAYVPSLSPLAQTRRCAYE